ncbi:dehydrogenase E1 component subunit alpha/beta [Leucobacter weissii]|uniref:dihydrolipoyllysine-residue succinyltransferase n=1 Tax=Leucobacter weissii TaxID=1983706 RepID=A0A939MMK0_9MICO|nr:dehydrogenase E1 component subunit alpha/beta [Leucobacter weissii]MBO1901547.1 dehydrogenase E1 component subunit alpha/beta [Leucobacter weissii]
MALQTAADEARARLSREQLVRAFRDMVRIRAFELTVSKDYAAGRIPGFVHVSLGQEAVAVGGCFPLARQDMITSNHRGHGHCLAKGLDPLGMFAELFGRDAGTVRGRGGSMHIADPDLGILGANGIVAAGLPIATGAGLAAKQREEGQVVVSFFGDGAVAQGLFHEAVNLAALWALPVVFLCENNGYAEFTAAVDGHPATLEQRAGGYNVPYVSVDGDDVSEVMGAMVAATDHARSNGPVIVEVTTVRWHGHYEGDQQQYRDRDDLSAGLEVDCLEVARRLLATAGVAAEEIAAAEAEETEAVAAAAQRAFDLPDPRPETVGDYVLAPRPEHPVVEIPADGEPMKYMAAIRQAMSDGLESDPRAVFAGIDVGAGGGVFAVSRGLADAFPGRVLDTPISESAILGLAVGGAMAGLRPLVEIMYLDFIGVAFDQVLNQAAKLHFMTAGRAQMGLTIRTQFGAGRSAGSQHSQSLEALLAHIPGLTVVMPATAADAYGLLRSAMQDPNPVIFIENRTLYGRRSPAPAPGALVPIGRARVVRGGEQVTVVSYSRMVLECEAVAEQLAAEGIDAEVIDLRTIAPWDRETVLASVEKTSRLVVVHEAVTDFGVGAEIVATVAKEGFWWLDAPIERVGARFQPAPYTPLLEREWLPGHEDIAAAIRRTVSI